jgi:hypothetical protein
LELSNGKSGCLCRMHDTLEREGMRKGETSDSPQ